MRKLYWNDLQSLVLIVQELQSEKVVVGSSDTVLGFLAPLTERGVSLLNEIKVRKDKPYITLIESALKMYDFVPPQEVAKVEKLIQACWPGPLTLICKARPELPAWMKAADGAISLRVPQHPGLLALLAYFPGLFSTSANITGEPVPARIEELDPRIQAKIGLAVLDDHQEPAKSKLPSTILDCSGPGIKLIRQGAYDVITLEKALGYAIDK